MKIAVFGASGAIGQLLVTKALKDGYEVIAYVRNPKKLTFTHSNLTVVKGELHEYDKIRKTIKEADTVVSTLGPSMERNVTGTPVLDGHINIIKAMYQEDKTRFITLGTPSIKFKKDIKSTTTVLSVLMGKIFIPKRGLAEMRGLGDAVRYSDLDWTLVRILAPVDDEMPNHVTVTFGDKKVKWKLSRKNIAAFMLDQVKDNTYIKSMPIIGG